MYVLKLSNYHASNAFRSKKIQNLVRRSLWRQSYGINLDIGAVRRLVFRIDTSEVPNFTAPCFAIEAFWISLLAGLQRRIQEYFYEVHISGELSRKLALTPER